jgi:hypothetical protein
MPSTVPHGTLIAGWPDTSKMPAFAPAANAAASDVATSAPAGGSCGAMKPVVGMTSRSTWSNAEPYAAISAGTAL